MWRCAYAVPVLGALAWWEQRRIGPRPWRERRPAAFAGVVFAVNMTIWHYAIRDIGAGLSTVLGNIQVVVVPFLALGDPARARPAQHSRGAPAGLRRRPVRVRRAGGRRLRRESAARGGVRDRRRAPLRVLPAHPARGQHGPPPSRRRHVRHDARRHGHRADRQPRSRRRGSRAGVAERRLADPARADVAGDRLAADHRVAAAAPRRDDVDDPDDPADRLGDPRRRPALRGTVGAPARRLRTDRLRARVGGDDGTRRGPRPTRPSRSL